MQTSETPELEFPRLQIRNIVLLAQSSDFGKSVSVVIKIVIWVNNGPKSVKSKVTEGSEELN